jgi:hypothetical protein
MKVNCSLTINRIGPTFQRCRFACKLVGERRVGRKEHGADLIRSDLGLVVNGISGIEGLERT